MPEDGGGGGDAAVMTGAAKFAMAAFSAAFLAEGYWLGARSARWTPVPAAAEVRAAAGIRSMLTATDSEIIVAVSIPGLLGDSLSVAVAGSLVTISCIAERPHETRRYEMIMPLPANADAARHRLVREGEAFKLIFEKLDRRPMNF
ncbi:MAG: hypothetical protein HYV14_02120 [Elusimicrobia bacterium]|nr:hypothetical protein [Elusimicrobiota bacterium]